MCVCVRVFVCVCLSAFVETHQYTWILLYAQTYTLSPWGKNYKIGDEVLCETASVCVCVCVDLYTVCVCVDLYSVCVCVYVPSRDSLLDVWFWGKTLTDDMYTHTCSQTTHLSDSSQTGVEDNEERDNRQTGEQIERQIAWQIQLLAQSHITHSQHAHTNKHMQPNAKTSSHTHKHTRRKRQKAPWCTGSSVGRQLEKAISVAKSVELWDINMRRGGRWCGTQHLSPTCVCACLFYTHSSVSEVTEFRKWKSACSMLIEWINARQCAIWDGFNIR